MGALLSAPGRVWPWLGILTCGLATSLAVARWSALPLAWLLLTALPLGLIGYGVLLIPAFVIAPPSLGAPLAAGVCAIGALWFGLRAVRAGRSPPPFRIGWPSDRGPYVWIGLTAFAAVLIGRAGARLALAVAMGAALPPVMGEPSSGDVGLTALRVALIARHGIPPPAPLDPDFPLQYRYLFHTLAASFAATGSADYARVTAGALGLVLASIVLAGAALAFLVTRSGVAWSAAGISCALYGPSYWLPDIVAYLARGGTPHWAALESLMGERWALSPLVSSFPSTFSSVASAPAMPMGVLAWLTLLLLVGATLRAPRDRRVLGGVLCGLALAALSFAADFFVPFAVAGVGAAALVARSHRGDRRTWGGWDPGVVAASLVAASAVGLVLLCTRQTGAAGAATAVRLASNSAAGFTATYGGNRALLAGGVPVALPNWVAVHDWGLLFWPGVMTAMAAGVRRGSPMLTGVAIPAALCAVFWHLFDVNYVTMTPTEPRVQMYRFATMATASGAPLIVASLGVALERPRALLARASLAALLGSALVVGSGAGAMLAYGATKIIPLSNPRFEGDAALARRLAIEPLGARFALLGGPRTFFQMYGATPAGYMPVWWALGGATVPVGWDFGHPERYEALYTRVVAEFDAGAAAELRLTHVAAARASLDDAERSALDQFLLRCNGEQIATWADGASAGSRALYRIRPAECGRA